jgi:hypothetical protein
MLSLQGILSPSQGASKADIGPPAGTAGLKNALKKAEKSLK